MTRLELLASILDSEALPHEMQAPQSIFASNIEFWGLCFEAKKILLEERNLKLSKKKVNFNIRQLKSGTKNSGTKDDTNKQTGNSEVAH